MKYSSEQMSTQITLFLKLLSVERNLTNRTLNAYRSDLHCFFSWCKHAQIETLDQNTILSYFHYLQTTLEQKASSIQRKYVSIHQFFHYINQEGLSSERFFRFSTRKFQLPKNLPRILSTAEIRRLLTAADAQIAQSQSQFHKSLNIRNNVILELLFCLGLRIGEISALNLEHYDSVDRTLLIHGKGRKERLLYISSPDVIHKLNAWLDTRDQLQPATPAMFLNRYGGRLSIYGIEKMFQKYRDLSAINPLSTPHYLRHSFATQLLNNGASIRDVQELLGHASIVTTQIYTEISISRRRMVLDKYNARNFLFDDGVSGADGMELADGIDRASGLARADGSDPAGVVGSGVDFD